MSDSAATQPIYQNCTFTTVIVGRNSDEAKRAKEIAGGHILKPGGHHGNNHGNSSQNNSGGSGGHHNNHGNSNNQNNSGNNSGNNSNQNNNSGNNNQNNNSGNNNNQNNNSGNNNQNNSGDSTPALKIALLIGLNYAGTPNELNGCINDVQNMKAFLVTKGFSESNIKVITDAAGPVKAKTVLSELEKLCAIQNAFLVFHYSGHGSNRRNNDSDENEPDGMDETVYVSDGEIHDDKIRKKVVKTPANSKLFMVFDSCHSGTICDLRYNLKVDRGRRRKISRDAVAYSLTENQSYPETAAQIMVVSGCKDEETSADAFENGAAGGALSMKLIPLLKVRSSWKQLITNLAAAMKESNYEQNPQLSFGKNMSLDNNHPF